MFDEPIFRVLPARYYRGGGQLEWPAEVLAQRRQLQAEIGRLKSQDAEFLRQAARRLGWSTEALDELRSEAGNRFVEQPQYSAHRVRTAKEEGAEEFFEEWAYLCASPLAWAHEEPVTGCGWVRGVPDERSYDNIGLLAGSTGTRDYCRVCGALIGENRQIIS